MVQAFAEIEAKRRQLGLTRRQVYEAAGIHHSTWAALAKGAGSPNLSTLEKLSLAIEALEAAADQGNAA